MKTVVHFLLFMVAVMILFISCNKNQRENENIEKLVLSGTLDSMSECKSLKPISKISDTSKFLSCIDYQFDSANNKLLIKHINAGFNCCLLDVDFNISTINDTLLIEEVEIDEHCYCLCLFDIFIQINGIEQKKYIVKFIEPYRRNQEQLIFEMDLTKFKTGIYCAQRNKYPWG